MEVNKEESWLQPAERLDAFIREDLKIIQNPEFFSFSLDAILLADFINLPHSRPFKYIDFCSGNGVIPLILSRRTQRVLEGIEIQAPLVDMAQRSAKLNGLDQQLVFHQADLKEWTVPHADYDIISCNPPYFLLENSNQAHQKSSHAIARHEITLTLDDWVHKARQLLKVKGRLYCVYRPERLDDLMESLLQHRFGIYRLKFIHPTTAKAANMVLVEAIYGGGRQGVRIEPPLYVHQADGSYTPEVRDLYYGDR